MQSEHQDFGQIFSTHQTHDRTLYQNKSGLAKTIQINQHIIHTKTFSFPAWKVNIRFDLQKYPTNYSVAR